MRSDVTRRITECPHPNGSGIPGGNWDATKVDAPFELLQAGFQLAYFIFPDRSAAIDIVVRALERLRVRSRREIKRLYWRDKHAERPVRRIARSDVDMLQWLIMFESDEDEKAQELAGNPSLRSMAIRYIKQLVQVTTALSSFYVNVGLTRLLRNYSTAEAQRIYEMLTSRYPGPDEYRRAKATLMEKVSQRFAGFLKITRVEHGELRFEIFEDQTRWVGLVDDCLTAFTPWSTQGHCSQFLAARGCDTNLASAYGAADIDLNELEMRCCHILIEPSCYSGMLKKMALDPPATKLALPRFFMTEKQEKSDDNVTQPRRPPELSQEDLGKIQQRLSATDARRRNMNPRLVIVVIDGVEHAQLDLTQKRQHQIEVKSGASLIEIRAEDDRGDLILATHFLTYTNNTFEISSDTAVLSKGKLKFAVAPIATPADGSSRAMLTMSYHPRFQLTQPLIAWRDFRNSRPAILSYAFAAVAMAIIAWGGAEIFYAHKIKVLEQELQQAHRNQQQLAPTAARAILSYTLTRDDQRVRGIETAGIPEISLLHSPAVSLELPLPPTAEARSYSAEVKTFTGDQTLMTQNFLQATRTGAGPVVTIVLPADLLKADTYYTVHLHSSDRTDRFTFKVVSNQ
ncbi:MAG: hypothetical protein WCG81_15285 [Candidatus Angelobacter sp.]